MGEQLNSKTLTAGAGSAGIGIIKIKSLAIQPFGKIEGGIYEV
jgi:hypothetical protein